MTLKKVIRITTSPPEQHLRIFRKIGYARCAVLEKTTSRL